MKRHILAIAMTICVSLQAFAQTEVSTFKSGESTGATYYLPSTVLDITLEAMEITRTPGEFSAYANNYLHITDAISKEQKYWEISSVKIKQFGTPDPEKMYTIKLANGSTASNIQLTEDGILQAINTKVTEATTEVKSVPAKKRIDPKSYLTEEILQATSTAKMAELTSKEIYEIRASKLAITRGQADNMPKDGLSMQLVLGELTNQEQSLTSLFTGTCDTVKYTCNIRLTPTIESDTTKAVLFRFSRKLGILKNDDLAGAPIYYDFNNLSTVPTATDDAKKKKAPKKDGVFVNIPGKAAVKIYSPTEVYYEETLPFGQLGTTESLSKDFFNKNNATKVILNKATGAVISIEN
ncbi:MAG: DUF4831 family protein [Bacteroidaceae bacterium]|nr:DUF4831 family protein [Bacteroidaceae bacterium]